MITEHNTLSKSERLNKKLVIDRLFAGGSKSLLAFPLRVVYMPVEPEGERTSILISVPKKRFRRAVKRNRVKRQVREAYRKNKFTLLHVLEEKGVCLALAFICFGSGGRENEESLGADCREAVEHPDSIGLI